MTRFDVNASILLTDLPLLQRPRAVRDAGFAGIEFWWPFETPVPDDRDVDEFVTAVQDAEVQLVSLNLFAGDMAAGERGLLSWPGRSDEFRDNLDATIGIGERLGCRIFNALYGNRLAGHPPEQQDELAAEQLAQAARAAARIEATVVVEPLSAIPDYPLRTAADVYAAIDRAGADNAANSRACSPTSTTCRSTATTSTPSSRTPLPSAMYRSPMRPVAASRGRERCRSNATWPRWTRTATRGGSASNTCCRRRRHREWIWRP